MAESQKHGFIFEELILKSKLNEVFEVSNFKINYTNKWDFPPISVKSFKYNSKNPSIEFGSINRIFENKENHILVLIGYEQVGKKKKVIFSDSIFINQDIMKYLKGNLDLNIIKELSQKLKTFKPGMHDEARIWANKMKKEYNSNTIYDIRFKIDSEKQRRIQCALKLNDLYNLKTNLEFSKHNKLHIPDIFSGKRIRNKK